MAKRIMVSTRIKKRWRKIHGNSLQYSINTALSKTKVSAEEFQKCWKRVRPTIPTEDLFRLFEKTFGSGHNLRGKVDFINYILRRCQNMGGPVLTDMTAWLKDLRLDRYAKAFIEAGYEDLTDIAEMSLDDAMEIEGMKKPHAKRICKASRNLTT